MFGMNFSDRPTFLTVYHSVLGESYTFLSVSERFKIVFKIKKGLPTLGNDQNVHANESKRWTPKNVRARTQKRFVTNVVDVSKLKD
jgi:hypothetical protein